MNIRTYLTPEFLFQINRVMVERADQVFFLIGAVLLVLAALFKFAAVLAPNRVDYSYRQKYFQLFLTVSICEILWYGARVEEVRFFGDHFVALLILFIGLVWFGFLVVETVKNYSSEKKSWEKEQVKLKYLSR